MHAAVTVQPGGGERHEHTGSRNRNNNNGESEQDVDAVQSVCTVPPILPRFPQSLLIVLRSANFVTGGATLCSECDRGAGAAADGWRWLCNLQHGREKKGLMGDVVNLL